MQIVESSPDEPHLTKFMDQNAPASTSQVAAAQDASNQLFGQLKPGAGGDGSYFGQLTGNPLFTAVSLYDSLSTRSNLAELRMGFHTPFLIEHGHASEGDLVHFQSLLLQLYQQTLLA